MKDGEIINRSGWMESPRSSFVARKCTDFEDGIKWLKESMNIVSLEVHSAIDRSLAWWEKKGCIYSSKNKGLLRLKYP